MGETLAPDVEAAVEQAFRNLYAKLDTLAPPAPALPYEQYAVSLLRAAGAELLAAATSLQRAADSLKFSSKLKEANAAIAASRRAREAAQGLV